jgi:hypothetical protein
MLMLVPHSGEVFITITNLQWIASLYLMVLAIQNPPERKSDAAIDVVALVAIGLSGPFIVLWLPVLAARLLWRRRSRYEWVLVTISGVLAAVQLGFVITDFVTPRGLRAVSVDAILAGARSFVEGTFLAFTATVPVLQTAGIAAVVASLIALLIAAPGKTRCMMAVLASGAVCLLAAAAVKAGSDEIRQFDTFGFASRYFYPPAVMAAWALILAAVTANHRSARGLAIMGMATIVASAATHFTAFPLMRYDWQEQVMNVRETPVAIPINPPGWSVTVRR